MVLLTIVIMTTEVNLNTIIIIRIIDIAYYLLQ